MPKGVYKHKPLSEEHKRKISKTLEGHILTIETKKKIGLANLSNIMSKEARKKMSEAKKGQIPWNKGKKHPKISGKNHPLYGKHLPLETRKKLSEAHKGRKKSKEAILKNSLGHIGHPCYKNPERGKKISETRKRLIKEGKIITPKGKDSSNWLGGKSFEPYGLDFNNLFKEKIRERDNYCCVICNKLQEELREKLHIHHIDYIKINNFKQNCVSLCRSCHSKTNINRHHWKIFFQSLLKERYGYEYTQDQKIILDFMELE